MPSNLALRYIFDDTNAPAYAQYRRFLKKPHEGTYEVEMSLRIGDHYNGEKTDIPFHDAELVSTIHTLAKGVNGNKSLDDGIYLYIPAHERTTDRTLILYAQNEKLAAHTASALMEIFSAYRNDDLDDIVSQDLVLGVLQKTGMEESAVSEFTSAAKPINPKSLKYMSREKITALYLSGIDLEAISDSLTPRSTDSPGRIKFKEDLVVGEFDGKRKTSLARLRSFLLTELNVIAEPSKHHDHCLDLHGKHEEVHLAYLVGKKVAKDINEGDLVKISWLENALSKARHQHSTFKANEYIGQNRAASKGPDLKMVS